MTDDDATIIEPSKAPKGIEPGCLLLNTYVVERNLGEGGMAITYLTHHKELRNTKHVIKVIKTHLSTDIASAFSLTNAEANIKVIDLLKREAESLISISHQAIVGYQGFQKDDNYGYCLVMEYVEGPTLKQFLKQRRLTTTEILQLRNRLAEGLAIAHAKGIFHRDISPDNIILADGKVTEAKLIDFGIAKRRVPNASEGTIFGPVFVGKYAYAAPEQINGGEIGAYTDIYSLALVLAEAVLGKKLDMGTSEESARKARLTIPNLSQIPKELKSQLTAMLHPNPKERLQGAPDLLKRWPYPPTSSKINKLLLLGSITLAASVIGLLLWPSDPKDQIKKADINRGYGYLTVHSSPEGALVLANDNLTFIGVTPVNKAFIAVGSNNVILKKNGYGNVEKKIEIKQNTEQTLDNIVLNKIDATKINQ